jgi:methionyl-tRNA formyltransferase
MTMKVLFLTNSEVSKPLFQWLSEREYVTMWQDKLAPVDILTLAPDLVVGYSYRHILQRDVLDTLPNKFVNLHIALLPYNRGADPNAWSFLDETPKGVTIHLIDEGIDTGAILIQKEFYFDETRETLGGSYNYLQAQIQDLFTSNWVAISNGSIVPSQQSSKGTYHHSKEFAAIKKQLLGSEGWGVTIQQFKQRYLHLHTR